MSFTIKPAVSENEVPEAKVGRLRKWDDICIAAHKAPGLWIPIICDTEQEALAIYQAFRKGDTAYLKGCRSRKRIARGENTVFVSWRPIEAQ